MRVLVSAWVGSTNVGDELVFQALLAKLRARGADVTVTSLDPAATEARFGVEAVPFRALRTGARAARDADLLIFGGGGLLQDATSILSVPAQVWRVIGARPLGTPVVGVGLGAGPLRFMPSRALVRLALGHHAGCTVRDEDSAATLRRCGVPDVRVAADLVISLPEPPPGSADGIVVCLRPWHGNAILPSRRGPDFDHEFVARAAAALDELASRLDAPVRLVAFERGRDDALNDRLATAMRTNATCLVPALGEMLDVIAGARVVIAMRYHAAIAALLANRPVVMLSYLPKVSALAEELGTSGVLLGAGADAFSGISAAVDVALANPDAPCTALARLRTREVENDRVLDRAVGEATTT